jgi:hypothetical protein
VPTRGIELDNAPESLVGMGEVVGLMLVKKLEVELVLIVKIGGKAVVVVDELTFCGTHCFVSGSIAHRTTCLPEHCSIDES